MTLDFATLALGAALGSALTLAAGGFVMVYSVRYLSALDTDENLCTCEECEVVDRALTPAELEQWRIAPSSSDAPASDALSGGDLLEAAFALDALPLVAAPVEPPPVWPVDRAGHGEHHIVREQPPEETEYDAYRGDSVSEAKRVWHLITDNPPSRGSITWYLPNGRVRAHVEFG